jgi:predicted MFS family arabinose efflux permease
MPKRKRRGTQRRPAQPGYMGFTAAVTSAAALFILLVTITYVRRQLAAHRSVRIPTELIGIELGLLVFSFGAVVTWAVLRYRSRAKKQLRQRGVPFPDQGGRTAAGVRRWHGLTAFRHRDFRYLWTATLVSNAGSWMQKVATAWLIYKMTGSEAWLGADAFASGMPTVVFLPWGGVLADRVERRTLLIFTNALYAVLALLLACLAGLGLLRVWHILTVSAAGGVLQAAMVPASASLLPSLVGEEDVPNAVALNSVQFNLSRVLGPAVGGATLIYLGAPWSFAFNAASFLILVLAFAFIKRVPPVKAVANSMGRSLAEGLAFVRGRRDLTVLLIFIALIAFLGAPCVSMLPALVKAVFCRDAVGYSTLLAAFGVGAVIAASIIAAFQSPLSDARITIVGLAVLGMSQISVALGGPFWLAIVLIAIAGLAFVGTMIRVGTAILVSTPDDFRGRVTSLQQICFRAAQPIGALLAGLLASRLGVRSAFWAFGGLLLLAVAVLLVVGLPSLRAIGREVNQRGDGPMPAHAALPRRHS